MAKIINIEGIGEKYSSVLQSAGVRTTGALLKQGASAKGRKMLAEKTSLHEDKILEWVNRADLFRIRGVGSEYSDLLEWAGVDSVPELAQRNPENLYQKLVAVNKDQKLVRRLPLPNQVADWVEQAGRLPKVVTH